MQNMKQVMLKLAEKPTNTYFQPAELFIILPVYIFYPIGPSSSGKTRAFGARIPQVRILSAQVGAVPKVWGSPNYFKFTSEFESAKI